MLAPEALGVGTIARLDQPEQFLAATDVEFAHPVPTGLGIGPHGHVDMLRGNDVLDQRGEDMQRQVVAIAGEDQGEFVGKLSIGDRIVERGGGDLDSQLVVVLEPLENNQEV